MTSSQQGTFDAANLKMAVVASRFNEAIVERLRDGAIRAFVQTGGSDNDISTYWCPGAFELPQVAARVASTENFDLLVCLGAVIRGETPHFDYICSAATNGLMAIAQAGKLAVGYGLLTCDTIDQAWNRAGLKAGNKGFEATMAAIETATLLREIA